VILENLAKSEDMKKKRSSQGQFMSGSYKPNITDLFGNPLVRIKTHFLFDQ